MFIVRPQEVRAEFSTLLGSLTDKPIFAQMGFFNDADTLESSSMLIYSKLGAGLYTQRVEWDTVLI
jgi:hypothetical protein